MNQPTLFISHGAPNIVMKPAHAAHQFFKYLGAELPRPDAVVLFSAHWMTAQPTVATTRRYRALYDFGNFDPRLFQLQYAPAGDPALAEEVATLLAAGGEKTHVTANRDLDHGAWIPLSLAYPDADIPVVLASIQPGRSPAHHYAMGRALRPLVRRGNVLLMGSGSLTHNLTGLSRYGHDDDPPAWVTAFADWMEDAIVGRDVDGLLDYRRQAPHARENHPTDEHLLPLYVAMGAAGGSARGQRIHSSTTYGTVMMDMYAFN